MSTVSTVDQLEAVLGARPRGTLLKSIAQFDPHCETLLAVSPVAVIGWQDDTGVVHADLVGGSPGFTTIESPTRARLPIEERISPAVGTAFASVYLVPGFGETLRINGYVAEIAPGELVIDLVEAYLHCAKCILRSRLWKRSDTQAADAAVIPADGPLAAVADALAHSSFAVLLSADASGAADASPKGDHEGFVQILDDRRIAIPDRPGNRRTDTLRNLLENPDITILALIPGSSEIVEVTGRAGLSTDADLLATMAVNGRPPKLAIVVEVDRAQRRFAPAIDAADLWNPQRHIDLDHLPASSQIWVDHMNLNTDRDEEATMIRSVVREPAIREGLALDYEQNLF